MKKYPQLLTLSIIYLVFLSNIFQQAACESSGSRASVKVGVILNMETSLGKISNTCISIAVEDFYKASPHYKTRVELHPRNSGNAVTTALFQAMKLLKKLEVHVIVGPQTSAQAETVAEVGNSSLVPVISFSATSPAIYRSRMPYFIRMTQNDTYQLEAICSFVQKFGWKHVIIIYEETDYVNDVIPNLVDMLQDIGVSVPYKAVISPQAEDLENKIVVELEKLKTMQTRIFIVHMSYSLGPQFFHKVKDVGLMSEGNAWIVTEELTNSFSQMDYSTLDSMRGAVGIKTYIQRSEKLEKFRSKMIRTMVQESATGDRLNTFCLKSYDTIWAIALAAEKLGPDAFEAPKKFENKEELADMGISQSGPQLLEQLLKSKFIGLSGEICFIDGELKPQVFEIVNVLATETDIGYWLPDAGLSRTPYNSSKLKLAPITWPGESAVLPRGWVIPANGEKLKVGYIVKEFFPEFVTINSKDSVVSGYCIDFFKAVMNSLQYEYPYDFVPFENIIGDGRNTYEDLVDQVRLQEFDAVVGDITITSNRSLFVDFSLPFTTGGVAMIIPIVYKKNAFFALFSVFSIGTWVAWILVFITSVMAISFFEYTPGSLIHQIGNVVSIAWLLLPVRWLLLPFGIVFVRPAERLKMISAFIACMYLVLWLTLSSGFLSQIVEKKVEYQQLVDVNTKELVKSGASVGYQKHSFIEMVLKQQKFDHSQLKAYHSPEDYDKALKKGSKNGGVDAIFDEIPYVEVFLKKYCGKYRKIVLLPTTYRIEGFGFVFPLGSSLVAAVSRAVLAVIESKQTAQIEEKWLGNCPDVDYKISSNTVVFKDLWVLFVVFMLPPFLAVFVFMLLTYMTLRHPNNKILKKLMEILMEKVNIRSENVAAEIDQATNNEAASGSSSSVEISLAADLN